MKKLLLAAALLAGAAFARADDYTGAHVDPGKSAVKLGGYIGLTDSLIYAQRGTATGDANVNLLSDPNLNLTLIKPACLQTVLQSGNADTSQVMDVRGWAHLALGCIATVNDTAGASPIHINAVVLAIQPRHHATQVSDSISTFAWQPINPNANGTTKVDTIGTGVDSLQVGTARHTPNSTEKLVFLRGYPAMINGPPRGRIFNISDQVNGDTPPPSRYFSFKVTVLALLGDNGQSYLPATGARVLLRFDTYGYR